MFAWSFAYVHIIYTSSEMSPAGSRRVRNMWLSKTDENKINKSIFFLSRQVKPNEFLQREKSQINKKKTNKAKALFDEEATKSFQ